VIVNQTMARIFWPCESALGKCIIRGVESGPCSEVVGVVEDSRRSRVIEEPTLQYFARVRPAPGLGAASAIVVRVDPARWPAVAAVALAELERHIDPAGLRMARLSESLEPQLRPWRLGAQLFTAFGVLALLGTLVGVYSVMAYAVSQRTHEMGVRIALGARLGDLLGLVVGEGGRVIALGIAVGLALSLALGRLVASLLYDVTPRDPAVLAAAAAVLLVAGLSASLIPAWGAARVDPMKALSVE
jgi:ABC-type antimicrobial peptide transport system permease subunit